MIRIYSQQGADVLRPYVAACGGKAEYAPPDSAGGVMAAFPNADRTALAVLFFVPGVSILPTNPGLTIPTNLFNALPSDYGILATDVMAVVVQKVHTYFGSIHWHPAFF